MKKGLYRIHSHMQERAPRHLAHAQSLFPRKLIMASLETATVKLQSSTHQKIIGNEYLVSRLPPAGVHLNPCRAWQSDRAVVGGRI